MRQSSLKWVAAGVALVLIIVVLVATNDNTSSQTTDGGNQIPVARTTQTWTSGLPIGEFDVVFVSADLAEYFAPINELEEEAFAAIDIPGGSLVPANSITLVGEDEDNAGSSEIAVLINVDDTGWYGGPAIGDTAIFSPTLYGCARHTLPLLDVRSDERRVVVLADAALAEQLVNPPQEEDETLTLEEQILQSTRQVQWFIFPPPPNDMWPEC